MRSRDLQPCEQPHVQEARDDYGGSREDPEPSLVGPEAACEAKKEHDSASFEKCAQTVDQKEQLSFHSSLIEPSE